MSITPLPAGSAALTAAQAGDLAGDLAGGADDGSFAGLVTALLGQASAGAAAPATPPPAVPARGEPVGAAGGTSGDGDAAGDPAVDPGADPTVDQGAAQVLPVWTPAFDALVQLVQPAGVAGPDVTGELSAPTTYAAAAASPSTDTDLVPGGDARTPATDGAGTVPAAGTDGGASTAPAAPAAGQAGPAPVSSPVTAPAAQSVAPVAAPLGAPLATATAPAGGARPAPVVAQVVPEVTRLVSRGDGVHRLTMRLQPEGLGDVRVTLTVRDGQVDVRLSAGDDARRALLEGAPELRRVLEMTVATEARVLVRDLAGSAAPGGQPGWAQAGNQAGQQDHSTAASYGGGDDASGRGSAGTQDRHAGTRGGEAAMDGHTDGATALRPDPAGRAPRGVDLTI